MAVPLPGLPMGRLSSHFRKADEGNKNLRAPPLVGKEPEIASFEAPMWSLRERESFLLLPKGRHYSWRKEPEERNPILALGGASSNTQIPATQRSRAPGTRSGLPANEETAHPPPPFTTQKHGLAEGPVFLFPLINKAA